MTYTTNTGTAISDVDYLNAAGPITFAPGEISKTLNMFAIGDATAETDETFTVTLSSPANATLDDATATATIRDDDRPSRAPKSDFNGDGKPDLLWYHDTTRALSVWLMDGVTRTATVTPAPAFGDAGMELIGTGDAYADGTADIFWRNPTTGDVSIWVMNGTTRVSVQPISPQIGDPNWRASAIADINSDGHPDVVWRHVDGWVAVSFLVGHTASNVQMLSADNVASPRRGSLGVPNFQLERLLATVRLRFGG